MAKPVDDNYSGQVGNSVYAGIEPVVAHVFIGSGQSNCQGVAAASDTPIPVGQLVGNVKTWRRSLSGNMYSGTGQWLDLEYATNQYEGRGQFVSVLKFAMNLRDNLEDTNNHIYIIKADGNGKPIAGWLNGGQENIAMYAGHITPALANLVANPAYDEIRIHSFSWDQGEGDSDTQGEANAYNTNLTTLISDLRTALSIPDLPVIIRRTESTHVNHTYVGVVAQAQEDVVNADVNARIIKGPWTYVGDDVHIDGVSQNAVGDERYRLTNLMTKGILYSG